MFSERFFMYDSSSRSLAEPFTIHAVIFGSRTSRMIRLLVDGKENNAVPFRRSVGALVKLSLKNPIYAHDI